ncbi:MAG: adenylosuccinate lyase [Candidatus Aenigmarchaeota archaeon CG_4_10_14_0_8_um_filter_37_24]|nr:adenylosuccinate lyase [Candidatus Aenigmarchaeota archaeon]OIN85344.1 MAG: adenylosuccinate lyase [Candidatus Aenigmarchaeota archaeon CG1_02_38_14]PIW40891.1 MAG: adenylosuccinate lyase [Candidatus Aenigmarchaeota archaeon CG15_BIG_FIL_POST_REV_8_21_14_020_37_27]PIX51163.1 MAG: adenylosuccinate lyase [Candidatus Aenigmarchaeota archaeon CG_4_8_14_3_um_filter_37_24]PIY36486.1 MAG: adenylosuccinate lyase [Candidatus Aenigmarchaeota archaeon CG_4_10_14_3_um_filter_37_21]PIZ34409.1 MAG: adeny
MNELTAISPVDGRYRKKVEALSEYFSEFALIKNRIRLEVEYLIFLSKQGIVRKLTNDEEKILRKLYLKFDLKNGEEVKSIEKITNHDMKAAEYFIKNKIKGTSLEDFTEIIHICLTTWDINNIAYALSIKESLKNIFLKEIESVEQALTKLAKENKDVVMLARTHGQPAVPTTLGKEIFVFAHRLTRQINQLKKIRLTAKFNGAVGNYNAHVATYPKVDWIKFSKDFIRSFGLEENLITTQIEPYDNFAEIFHNIIRINNIFLDLDMDLWTYISMDYLKQKVKEDEIGSSAMPQKVNPIDFENSEGNIGVANSLLNYFCNKLAISRLQRDLSDSTVIRNIGVAFAHSIIAYQSTLKGLEKIEVNKGKISQDLKDYPEIISEGIQTILRREGIEGAYEKMKELTRGKKIGKDDIKKFIKNLNVAEEVKKELLELAPENYIGLAKKICDIKL